MKICIEAIKSVSVRSTEEKVNVIIRNCNIFVLNLFFKRGAIRIVILTFASASDEVVIEPTKTRVDNVKSLRNTTKFA